VQRQLPITDALISFTLNAAHPTATGGQISGVLNAAALGEQ
jgi:hypothetical protein